MVLADGSQSDTLWVKIEKMATSASFPQVGLLVVMVEKVTCPGDHLRRVTILNLWSAATEHRFDAVPKSASRRSPLFSSKPRWAIPNAAGG